MSKIASYSGRLAIPFPARNEMPVVPPIISSGGSTNWYRYGIEDRYPNWLVQDINNSSTARNCIEKITTYLVGNGFSGFNGNEIIGNNLLSEIAMQMAVFRGFALLIKYKVGQMQDDNGNYYKPQIADIEVLPLELCRKFKDGRIMYNPNLYFDNNKKEQIIFDEWKPKTDYQRLQEIESQKDKEYKGTILYRYMPAVGAYIYPIPAWAANREAVQAEGELSQMLSGQLKNGFMPSLVALVTGDISNNTITEGEQVLENPAQQISRMIADNVGAKNAGGTVVINMPDPDGKIDFKVINPNTNSAEIVNLQKMICENIARIFNISPILVGISTSGQLSSTQQIAVEIKSLNINLQPLRDFICQILNEVTGLQLSIIESKPITDIDPVLEKVLTADEIREIYGYEPLTKLGDANII
jgi:hypothetical protein